MRVLLVQAPLGRPEPPTLPLGLCFLAGALGDHEVRIVDPNAAAEGELESAVATWTPDVVGLSIRNVDTTRYKDRFSYIGRLPGFTRHLRTILGPETPIIIGGTGFSLFPGEILRGLPEVRAGLCHEAEATLPALLSELDHPERVPGAWYRDGSMIRSQPPGPRPEVGALRPRYDLVPIERYLPFTKNWSVGVQASRGCALTCAYCSYRSLSGEIIRPRPDEQVLDEVEALHRRGVRRLFFTDAVFNMPAAHASAIAEGLIARRLDLQWRAYHNECSLSAEYLGLAVRSGCREFSFSPDAFSDRSLARLGKVQRTADVWRALDLVRQTPGASAAFNFFLGLPGQELTEYRDILHFYREARRALGRRLLGVRLSYVRLMPGTPLHHEHGGPGSLLAWNDADLRPLFLRDTGHLPTDLLLRLLHPHRWPLERRW